MSSRRATFGDVGMLAEQVVDVVGDAPIALVSDCGVGGSASPSSASSPPIVVGNVVARGAVVDDDRRGDLDAERRLQLRGDPAPDRVVASGEVPGVVGVEALDTFAGAADTAGRAVDGGGRDVAASRSAA